MAVFTYKAFDPRQRPENGTITADTAALARGTLRARGWAIVSLDVVRPRSSSRWWPRRSRRHGEQVAELWRNLAVLLEAGVPLAEALAVGGRQLGGPLRDVLRQIEQAVRRGQAFSEALALHPSWFDRLTLSIVEVGQHSGALSHALAELAEYHSRRQAVANRLGTALIYPVILCLVGAAVVVFLMTQVVPQLVEVLASAGRELPAPTRLLKALSDGLLRYAPLLAIAAVALVIGVGAIYRTGRGRRWFERGLLAVPVVGELVRKAWIARITMMLATLLRADVRFVEALRQVRQGLSHGLYADELQRLETAVEAGADIADPLRGSRLMPPLVAHLLAVGQESGELPRMLAQLRESYDKQVQLALARFLAVLEPALILILAVVIGFVVFATLLPILETTRMMQ